MNRPEPARSTGPVHISGTAAVRPDRISSMLQLAERARAGPAGAIAAAPSRGTDSAGSPLAERDGSEMLHPVGKPVSDPALRTVTGFYEQVGTAPADAFDLLGEQLQGSGYPSFAAAWATVVQVRIIGIRKVTAGEVLVAVQLERAHRRALCTLQRVAVGRDGRIRDVTLLAATTDS